VSSESEALTEIRALNAEIIKCQAGVIDTHYETCFMFHAGCLAVRVDNICAQVTS